MTQPDPPEQRPYVTTKDFMRALHDAGILPQYPWCSRVVIDCDGRQGVSTVKMYVDQIPSGALLAIPALMTEVQDDSA